jgi:hypothetical protein
MAMVVVAVRRPASCLSHAAITIPNTSEQEKYLTIRNTTTFSLENAREDSSPVSCGVERAGVESGSVRAHPREGPGWATSGTDGCGTEDEVDERDEKRRE